MLSVIDQRAQEQGKVSWRFVLGLLLILTIAQLLLYRNVFDVKPAGDDFSGLTTDIHRGELESPLSFFLASNQPKNYRPLQSLFMWAVARWTMPEPWIAVHVLHFASMFLFGACAILWTRVLPLGKLGVVVAGALMYFHPAITPQLAGIDGYSCLVANACTWGGALAVYVHRDRPLVAASTAGALLLIGSLFKEYTFGLAPLAILIALLVPVRRRSPLLVALVLILGLIGAGLMLVRTVAVLPGFTADVPVPSLDPTQVAKNLALFAAVMVYFGHVAWVYVHRDLVHALLFGASALITILLIGVGLARGLRGVRHDSENEPPGSVPSMPAWRWAMLFGLSFIPASFPANVMPHVSEMYVGALVLPLAMLGGLAAEGIASMATPGRVVASLLFVGQLTLGAIAIDQKVKELKDVGDRAARMAAQLDALLPAEADNSTIALIFPEAVPGAYSIYRMADHMVLHPDGGLPWTGTLSWLRPTRRLHVEMLVAPEAPDLARYDYIYIWDRDKGIFTPLTAD